MSAELLSVCIPTYNRSGFLRDLLGTCARQLRADRIPDGEVVFYVSDNASPDATPEVVREFQEQGLRLVYHRNPANVGVSRNLLQVCRLARGRFLWTLGDDELVNDQALRNILQTLREHEPGLILAFNRTYPYPLPPAQVFEDYQAFTRACIRLGNTHPLAEQTLLSSNIFRADCYDPDYAAEKVDTWFPHMFGIIRPLCRQHAPVVLPAYPIISIREATRSGPADGVWADLDACWHFYLSWLREEMQMPELDPDGPARMARQAMFRNMLRHPVSYLRRNWRALFQPSAYKFVFSRLLGRRS